jgi:uncharacterized protein (DUF427 family)
VVARIQGARHTEPMAIVMRDLMLGALPELRMQPVDRWVRAAVGDQVVLSSKQARLVWEPRRVVPSYAVPRADVSAELVPYTGATGSETPVRVAADGPPVLDPRTPFTVHTCPGEVLSLRTGHADLPGAAFAPRDDDLAGYVVLDWAAFSQWYEEDEPVLGHPHDPHHRIDCLRSSRHVEVSAGGRVLADTRRATMLFEDPLPVRYYIPREDVRLDVLEPSDARTVCAYKGQASYWSARAGDTRLPQAAWTYREPLHDAEPVRDLVAFFTERVDLVVDGVEVPRPVTPWS